MPDRGDTKSVGGKNYQWSGRRWVPARDQPAPARTGGPQRSDFGSGRSGAAAFSEAQRSFRSGTPQGTGGNVTNVGGKSYNMSDPAQVTELNSVLETDRASRPNQQFADLRGGGGLKPDGSGRFAPAPNGSGASGTRTGPAPMTMEDANKILNRGGLKDQGYTVQNPFTSNQLPATSTSPYFDKNPQAYFNQDLPENMFVQESGLQLTRNAFDAQSGVEYSADSPQQPATGEIEATQLQGSPLTISSGVFQASNPNEAAQQPEINKALPVEREKSELEKGYKPDMARRRAFLNPELSSMEALRAVEAQKGVVFTGNTYNLVNPNAGKEGENAFMQIDKKQRDTIMRGGEGAQTLLDSYVKDIAETSDKPDDEDDNK